MPSRHPISIPPGPIEARIGLPSLIDAEVRNFQFHPVRLKLDRIALSWTTTFQFHPVRLKPRVRGTRPIWLPGISIPPGPIEAGDWSSKLAPVPNCTEFQFHPVRLKLKSRPLASVKSPTTISIPPGPIEAGKLFRGQWNANCLISIPPGPIEATGHQALACRVRSRGLISIPPGPIEAHRLQRPHRVPRLVPISIPPGPIEARLTDGFIFTPRAATRISIPPGPIEARSPARLADQAGQQGDFNSTRSD